jgi:predicted dehydrogenase
MKPVRIGLIGAGTMGAFHARVIASHPDVEFAWVCDQNPNVARRIGELHKVGHSVEPDLSMVDAVVVATPTQFHHKVAKSLLDQGIPLLVEKPLAQSMSEVNELAEIALTKGVVLQCGLLERFNPAFQTLLDLCRNPLEVRTVRHSPPASRIVTGVSGDLLIHDIDLVLRLFASTPVSQVAKTDGEARPSGVEETAELLLEFSEGRIAALSASRRSHRKVRSIQVIEEDRLIDVDLLRRDITIYKHMLESSTEDELGYRQQTIMEIPVIAHQGEPLRLQLDHFLSLLRHEVDPSVEIGSIIAPHQILGGFEPVAS